MSILSFLFCWLFSSKLTTHYSSLIQFTGIMWIYCLSNVICVCREEYTGVNYFKTDCGLIQVPPDLPAQAKEVRLENNEITSIPEETFLHLNQCIRLFLKRNRLTHLKSGMFEGLQSLRELYLHDTIVSVL